MDYIKIDRYESRIVNNKVRFFAIAGKEEYEMPDCYKEMYNNDHLAIREQYVPFKELFDLENERHYIPLNTVIPCQKKPKK